MKLFYVYYHSYEDMPIHVSDVVEELLEQGDEVYLFTSIKNSFLRDNCPWRHRSSVVNIPVLNIRFLNRLCYSLLLTFILPWWCLAERPSVIYERASISAILTVIIARLFRIPYTVEVNGIVVEELRMGRQSSWRILITRFWESFVYRNSDLIIAVTEKTRESLMTQYLLPPRKIKVVTNGTNIRRFRPFSRNRARECFKLRSEQVFYVGYLGTLTPWCGADLIPECAPLVLATMPSVQFLIGGGQEPYLTSLRKQVETKAVKEHFRFFGNIPWSLAGQFISTFDIAVVPTLIRSDSGASPLKLFSYMACGKPVVGSDAGETGEVIRRYRAGLTFTPGDPRGLAEAIIALLQDPERRNEIKSTAREIVKTHYSWGIRVAQMKESICKETQYHPR